MGLGGEYFTVKSEFETREPFYPGGTQFHTGLKKNSKTFVNLRKGKLTTGNVVDCVFPSWWKEPLVGSQPSQTVRCCGRRKQDLALSPSPRSCTGAAPGSTAGIGTPQSFVPPPLKEKEGFLKDLKESVKEPKEGKHHWALSIGRGLRRLVSNMP